MGSIKFQPQTSPGWSPYYKSNPQIIECGGTFTGIYGPKASSAEFKLINMEGFSKQLLQPTEEEAHALLATPLGQIGAFFHLLERAAGNNIGNPDIKLGKLLREPWRLEEEPFVTAVLHQSFAELAEEHFDTGKLVTADIHAEGFLAQKAYKFGPCEDGVLNTFILCQENGRDGLSVFGAAEASGTALFRDSVKLGINLTDLPSRLRDHGMFANRERVLDSMAATLLLVASDLKLQFLDN